MPTKKPRFPKKEFHSARLVLLDAHSALKRNQPLKIGIREELCGAHPDVDPGLIQAILSYHTNSLAYLKALGAGGQRYDMDGQPVEKVEPGHQEFALEKRKTIKQALKKQKQSASKVNSEGGKLKPEPKPELKLVAVKARLRAAKARTEAAPKLRRPTLRLKRKA